MALIGSSIAFPLFNGTGPVPGRSLGGMWPSGAFSVSAFLGALAACAFRNCQHEPLLYVAEGVPEALFLIGGSILKKSTMEIVRAHGNTR